MDSFEVGTLKLKNVPVLIKAPALRGIPKRETESFSPLALGLSMTIDYASKKLTIGEKLPEEPHDISLGLRHHRLALVRGLINGTRSTYFVVDTGGEVISISTATAQALAAQPSRKIALKVYGTSGWDRDAFLLPGVNLNFSDICVQELLGGRPQPARAERAPRLRGGRDRRAQVPQPVSRGDGSRKERAEADADGELRDEEQNEIRHGWQFPVVSNETLNWGLATGNFVRRVPSSEAVAALRH